MKGKVDLLDLVSISITRLPPKDRTDQAPLAVDFTPFDKTKQVVFDEKALETLNYNISEKVKQMQLNAADPKSLEYVREFVGRVASELYRNGLVGLETIPDSPDDPYKNVRKIKR